MSLRPLALAAALAMAVSPALVIAGPAQAAETTDAPAAVTRIAIVMPLTVPITDPAVVYVAPAHAPVAPSLIDAETLAYYTSPTGALTTQLDAVYNSGVTIGIDPMIIASIRALGSSVPESARLWLDRLAGASNETFALTYADSDMTAPLQAGRTRVVRAGSLDFAIDPTLFAAPTTATPDPSTPPDIAAAPPLPTTDDLFAWNYTLPSVAWPRANTVTRHDFTTISNTYDTTILSSGNAKRTDLRTAAALVGKDPVVIADDTVSTLADAAIRAETVDEWNAATAALGDSLTASAASSTTDSADSTVVLTLDRDQPLPSTRVTATVAAIADLDTAQIVGLGDIVDSSFAAATVIDEPQSDARVARTKVLLSQESDDASFAAIAENPGLITGERRVRLLVTMSPAAQRQAGGWGAATNGYLDESTALHDSVRLERSSDIVLLADRESIRPAVTNNLDQPITVYVEVRALNPNLTIEDSRVKLTIKPNSQGKASVPVQSVSNGQVELAVRLMSADEYQIGSTEHLKITVQAGWEGPFTLIAGIVVVLVFAFGIVRSVTRRRAVRASLLAGDSGE